MIPEIAIVGHPNEGKSSVLSTLAEDDSVRISPYPGETTRCRTFPVIIDHREILRFTDTPGFQSPAKLLAKLQTCSGSSAQRLAELRAFTGSIPELKEDHELLEPISRGAGIIYVVDGSRPIRQVDRDEMEILRLIGRPRMAVINAKQDAARYLGLWKEELARHFNGCRVFNAHRATYAERIALLEALKSVDQDWQAPLADAIAAISTDWQARARLTAQIISDLLSRSLTLQLSAPLKTGADEQEIKQGLVRSYTDSIADLEKAAHAKIRKLFKHNIFNYQLPPHSILHEDLFSERSWKFLGLSKKQFILLGGIGGGVVGAGVEMAALGHGLGLFTALGAMGGVLGALGSRQHLDREASLLGIKIGGPQVTIGPAQAISLLFILINRSLLFYQHVINWAHGRRDYRSAEQEAHTEQHSYTRQWSSLQLKQCHDFFKSAQQPDSEKHQSATAEIENLLYQALMQISHS